MRNLLIIDHEIIIVNVFGEDYVNVCIGVKKMRTCKWRTDRGQDQERQDRLLIVDWS